VERTAKEKVRAADEDDTAMLTGRTTKKGQIEKK
jgi:hypothetical protein